MVLTGAALAMMLAMPASAAVPAGGKALRSGASTFVAARAAADAGDARRAARLYASLATAEPSSEIAAQRALGQAILAGDMNLALRLLRTRPGLASRLDARLLRLADRLRANDTRQALVEGEAPELGPFRPFVAAWILADRGDWRGAARKLEEIGADHPLASFAAEHKALILLAARKPELARPLLTPALTAAKGRATRLRVLFASGMASAGDTAGAQTLLSGPDATLRAAADNLRETRRPRALISTAGQAFAELVSGLALDIDRADDGLLALGLAQVARFADPDNDHAALLLALLLEEAGREDDGLALLRSLPATSPFLSEARNAEVRALLDAGRREEALARAQALAIEAEGRADDWMRLGDALDAMDRHAEAAAAYGAAAAAVGSGAPGPALWSLHLLRGAALEQAGQWPQAESALELAHKLAPDNPVVLNYLGYARLERGEQLDEAETLIAEASRRAPDDASITDSLGWAQFKRGKVTEAIATLERAAAADPAQAEIHEHLGDALYTAGRKYEARFAWNAALVAAGQPVRRRVEAKLVGGLNSTNAAP